MAHSISLYGYSPFRVGSGWVLNSACCDGNLYKVYTSLHIFEVKQVGMKTESHIDSLQESFELKSYLKLKGYLMVCWVIEYRVNM